LCNRPYPSLPQLPQHNSQRDHWFRWISINSHHPSSCLKPSSFHWHLFSGLHSRAKSSFLWNLYKGLGSSPSPSLQFWTLNFH
jgi:hypothetical protein